MPLGNFSGLTQDASLGQVMDYLYRVQKELDYLTSTLETDNINRLDAKVLQLGTLDVNNVTVQSSLTGTAYIQMDATGMKAYNGTINTFEIDSTGKAYFRDTIEGAQIISDSSINITTDLYVGNNIYLGSGVTTTKRIQFDSAAYIESTSSGSELDVVGYFKMTNGGTIGTTSSDILDIYADATIVGPVHIEGTIDFTNATSVTGLTNANAGGHNHGIPSNAALLYGHYDSTTSTWIIDGSYGWVPAADHTHTIS